MILLLYGHPSFLYLPLWYSSQLLINYNSYHSNSKMACNFLFLEQVYLLHIGCGIQSFFLPWLWRVRNIISQAFMAYDRYVAICFPLHCPIIISERSVCLMIWALWEMGSPCSCTVPCLSCPPPTCQSETINVSSVMSAMCDSGLHGHADPVVYSVYKYYLLPLLPRFHCVACSYDVFSLLFPSRTQPKGRKALTCSTHLAAIWLSTCVQHLI